MTLTHTTNMLLTCCHMLLVYFKKSLHSVKFDSHSCYQYATKMLLYATSLFFKKWLSTVNSHSRYLYAAHTLLERYWLRKFHIQLSTCPCGVEVECWPAKSATRVRIPLLLMQVLSIFFFYTLLIRYLGATRMLLYKL